MSVLHLWLGLLSSVIIFLVCITGSIYAFKNQIEDQINRECIWLPEMIDEKIKPSLALRNFEDAFGKAIAIRTFGNAKRSIEISSISKNTSGIVAYYHPVTGEFIGMKNQSTQAFFATVLEIHRFLLAGDAGKVINGCAVLIFVFMLISGFMIWIPRKLRQLKDHLRIRWRARFYRLNFDLHRILGFYSLSLLFLIAVTGLYVSFHWMKNAIIIGLGGESVVISETNTALKNELSSSFSKLLNDLSEEKSESIHSDLLLEMLMEKSDSIFHSKGIRSIQLPNDLVKTVRVTNLHNDNGLGIFVPDFVSFSTSGSIREVKSFTDLPLHEQFKEIAKPLHTGEIVGLPGIITYFIVSLIGCSLPVTGFMIWWKKFG